MMTKALVMTMFMNIMALGQVKRQSPRLMPLGDVKTFAAVYYAEDSLSELSKFDMVVLDPANYDSAKVATLESSGCLPVAYLNIGEMESYRSYFEFADTSMMLSADPYWRDRYYADVCNPEWQDIILKNRIPKLLKRGFCGLFIDLANVLNEYPQMSNCVVSLIKKIRKEVGRSYLILDGGSRIVDRVGNEIDGLAVEGLMGFYDFESEDYEVRADSIEDRVSDFLIDKGKKFKIRIFQLDYASPSDESTRDKIIIQSRRLGFVPYVGTIELDTLFTNTVRKIRLPESQKGIPFPD